jgi:hypothetical protein
MKSVTRLCLILVLGNFAYLQASPAQEKPDWIVGMRVGLSLGSGGGQEVVFNYQTYRYEQKSSINAGFQFGPTGEVIFKKQFAIVENLNINTQAGTPIEWSSLFKYYFPIQGSQILPYADAGFSLFFVTGGPYVGIPFGGGAMFPIAENIYIPADAIFGPIFVTNNTQFGIELTTGIRFML